MTWKKWWTVSRTTYFQCVSNVFPMAVNGVSWPGSNAVRVWHLGTRSGALVLTGDFDFGFPNWPKLFVKTKSSKSSNNFEMFWVTFHGCLVCSTQMDHKMPEWILLLLRTTGLPDTCHCRMSLALWVQRSNVRSRGSDLIRVAAFLCSFKSAFVTKTKCQWRFYPWKQALYANLIGRIIRLVVEPHPQWSSARRASSFQVARQTKWSRDMSENISQINWVQYKRFVRIGSYV